MNRREFLKRSAAAAAIAAAPSLALGQTAPATTTGADPSTLFDRYYQPIFDGFLRNARATCGDYVVCDYPGGTKLKSCCTPSGKTYVSVARMLPAMVERRSPAVDEILLSVFRNAFDPKNPNFWGLAPATKPTQLSVEAALVAWSLAQSGEDIIKQLTSEQRANIQAWLASCTQFPERKTNHAWFTAINQAARLKLSRTFPEFKGDEAWMLEDVKALDGLYGNGTDGWYSDAPDQPIYDIYNFYVFPNFPLMWGRVIGEKYPQWNDRFHARVKTFLEKAPHFFAANGCHPLMGRSLIYRWAVLSPLVLGYREGLWPHSPGLLRRIVRQQFEYHWNLGCFDETAGKLRESYSAADTDVTREVYVDNGHPYWAMLGFAFRSIPKTEPFWTVPEEPLPVEKGDYTISFAGPKFFLSGIQRTGEVRWVQSQSSAKRDPYRDKYSKFVWSSHFGFNAARDAKDAKELKPVPADQALVFRNKETGATATRAPNGVTSGKILPAGDGVETEWFAQLGDWKIQVVSTIRLIGEFEERTHRVTAPADAVGKVQVIEGTYAVADDGAQPPAEYPASATASLKFSQQNGTIGIWIIKGHEHVGAELLNDVNLIHKTVLIKTTSGELNQAQTTFASLHYASPNAPAKEIVMARGTELVAAWKG